MKGVPSACLRCGWMGGQMVHGRMDWSHMVIAAIEQEPMGKSEGKGVSNCLGIYARRTSA
jgi:hypothetical protein